MVWKKENIFFCWETYSLLETNQQKGMGSPISLYWMAACVLCRYYLYTLYLYILGKGHLESWEPLIKNVCSCLSLLDKLVLNKQILLKRRSEQSLQVDGTETCKTPFVCPATRSFQTVLRPSQDWSGWFGSILCIIFVVNIKRRY